MSEFFQGMDDLESFIHLHELTQASKHAMVGGEVDPLKRLMDPIDNQPWEYDLSRTEVMLPGALHAKQQEALWIWTIEVGS